MTRRRIATLALVLPLVALPVGIDTGGGVPRLAVATARADFFEDLSRSINRSLGYEPARKKTQQRRKPARRAAPVEAPLPPVKPAAAAGSGAAVLVAGAVAAGAVPSPATPAASVPAPSAAGPAEPPRVEFVVSGLPDSAVVTLATEGYRIVLRRESSLLGEIVLLLEAPDDVTFAAGRDRIHAVAPEARVDTNARYRLERGSRCAGAACPDGPATVAGPGATCAAPVRLGLVAGRPDLNRPGLALDRIDLVADQVEAGPTDATLVERWTARLPQASLAVHAVAAEIDAFALAAAFDRLHDAGAEVVVAGVAGPSNGLLAAMTAALAAEDVAVVSPAGFARGPLQAGPGRLEEIGGRVAALRSTRPYLNTAGIEHALGRPGSLAEDCAGAVAIATR